VADPGRNRRIVGSTESGQIHFGNIGRTANAGTSAAVALAATFCLALGGLGVEGLDVEAQDWPLKD
jgi:hypothetical protein